MTLRNKNTDLIGIFNLIREEGRHKIDGVVRLQETSPVGNEAVASRVRLIESVARESCDLIEDEVGIALIDLVRLGRAFDKNLTLLLHRGRILFTHRTTKNIRTAEGITCEHFGRVLHLLLVNHDPVGISANLLKHRVLVIRLLAALLHLDHLIDILHRPGAVYGEKVNDVLDLIDPVFAAGLDHTT